MGAAVRFCDASVRNRTGVWLSLGSNIGDRRQHLAEAIAALPNACVWAARISPLYGTAPVGLRARAFFNCVLAGETSLLPRRLLGELRRLELALGRRRLRPGFAPRTIDIDLLAWNRCRMATPVLTLPHPASRERRFLWLGLRAVEGPAPLPANGVAGWRQQAVHVVACGDWWRVK